jgi:hypothetical protein
VDCAGAAEDDADGDGVLFDKFSGCGMASPCSAAAAAAAAAANCDILLSLWRAAAEGLGLVGAACTGMCLDVTVVVLVDDTEDLLLLHMRSPAAAAAACCCDTCCRYEEQEEEVLGLRIRLARISFLLLCSCAMDEALLSVEASSECLRS